MSEQTPATAGYDAYIGGLFATEDDPLTKTRAEMQREGLPSINVSATEGKLLHVLALSIGAKRILEIGTLGGYSGIWLARALPEGGKMISLKLDQHHADVAQRNLANAGVANKVEIRVGPASKTLSEMQGEAPFDLVFIDADKDGYVGYLAQVLPLVRKGGLILADNTLPNAALDGSPPSGTMRYNSAAASESGLVSITVPVLRHGGIDGLTISVKG